MIGNLVLCGIDASLNHACMTTGLNQFKLISTLKKNEKYGYRLEYKTSEERLLRLYTWYTQYMRTVSPHIVAIEDYAYAAKHQTHQIGEGVAMLKLVLAQNTIPYIVVDPNTVKKFFTGKGNESKELMCAKAVELGLTTTEKDVGSASYEDIADSLALYHILQGCTGRLEGITKQQLSLLTEERKEGSLMSQVQTILKRYD